MLEHLNTQLGRELHIEEHVDTLHTHARLARIH